MPAPIDPRLRARDPAAIADLYDQHIDDLYAFVFYRVGKDPALAEDVVQDTFVEALGARLDDYDPERGSFGTWLKVLSRNVARTHLRAHTRRHDLIEAWDQIDAKLAAAYAALAETPLSDEVLERRETCDLVNMTVAELPEHYRDVLERKYVAGESMDDIAAHLEVSRDAVKSLLARARRAFRTTFETLANTLMQPARPAQGTAETR